MKTNRMERKQYINHGTNEDGKLLRRNLKNSMYNIEEITLKNFLQKI